MGNANPDLTPRVSIGPLLRNLRPLSVHAPNPNADDVAAAISHIFANELTDVQATIFLHDLFITKLDQRPDILAKSASAMRAAAAPINLLELESTIQERTQKIGDYNGGLCDIVGTGGDGWSTFNISTASSILASSLLFIAKHGNRASTSKSGSADVLESMRVTPTATPAASPGGNSTTTNGSSPPEQLKVVLDSVTPQTLSRIYAKTNYAFLYAHTFHPWVKNAAHIRRQLDHPTIFNFVGPLANPVHALLEARVIGVRKCDLVPVFAEALRMKGVRKAMVVCGAEDLDEISCAGPTHCARLVARGSPTNSITTYSSTYTSSAAAARRPPTNTAAPTINYTATMANGTLTPSAGGANTPADPELDIAIEYFTLRPSDFGLPAHALDTVSPGLTAGENAAIMHRLLAGELRPEEQPIMDFVLMNTAALFVIAGVCEGAGEAFGGVGEVIKEVGPGGGRWKEGVRLARLAVSSGRALEMLRAFMEVTSAV